MIYEFNKTTRENQVEFSEHFYFEAKTATKAWEAMLDKINFDMWVIDAKNNSVVRLVPRDNIHRVIEINMVDAAQVNIEGAQIMYLNKMTEVEDLEAGSDIADTQWQKEYETFTYWKLKMGLIFYVHVDRRGQNYEYLQTGCISKELYQSELKRFPKEGWEQL